MPLKDTFQPYDRDAEVVDSLFDVPLDDHDPAEDGDDSHVPSQAPGLLRRLTERVNPRG